VAFIETKVIKLKQPWKDFHQLGESRKRRWFNGECVSFNMKVSDIAREMFVIMDIAQRPSWSLLIRDVESNCVVKLLLRTPTTLSAGPCEVIDIVWFQVRGYFLDQLWG